MYTETDEEDWSMTEKLYDQDAYAREFTAKVISCEECGEGRYKVVLDRTLFFPEEGGQTPDKGTINGLPVVDVQIKNEIKKFRYKKKKLFIKKYQIKKK